MTARRAFPQPEVMTNFCVTRSPAGEGFVVVVVADVDAVVVVSVVAVLVLVWEQAAARCAG
eukprot:CAMPEP_0115096472 /NCGR_PEP_ID=MMETSP0227-20121206/29749_1 /TAXON_ID=89957 /ORGANISM="Polarella glacialis, Strain CCMP 1383" /LENGTH=60 /DNA_ID=CAMNT_0002490223 /DNA_START=63 /DNA_END=241 /DNA_ORIENTATION=-